MSTVQDIVSRALRILRVTDVNAAPKAADMKTGIVALNSLMRRWEANGLALGWSDVANPAEDLPAPPEAEEAITFNLAMRLRTEYGTALEPDVVRYADESLAALRRDRLASSPLRLRARTPRSGTYNIYTDEACD